MEVLIGFMMLAAFAFIAYYCLICLPFKFLRRRSKRLGAGITLLVPFRSDEGIRAETWAWLREYWRWELPHAEIVEGHNEETPFCKTAAVNEAARIATGDVFVIMDADCYIDGKVLIDCAKRIRRARKYGGKLWFIPYRRFFRLTESVSRAILESDPRYPLHLTDPPPLEDLLSNKGTSNGHWFGALIQVMPAEAFYAAGGMDERFAGWGGEDIAFMRAVDTMYTKHRTTDNGVFHLWHPRSEAGDGYHRLWPGQTRSHTHWNDVLTRKYFKAYGDRRAMRRLLSGGFLIGGRGR
jgi:hypothetical protein